jgi:hypothetical protein
VIIVWPWQVRRDPTEHAAAPLMIFFRVSRRQAMSFGREGRREVRPIEL